VYSLTSLGTGVEGARLYIYRVTIPQFPFPHPHNQFQSYGWRPSPEEAKLEAAQFVLACLRISPDYVCSLGAAAAATQPAAPPATMASLPQVNCKKSKDHMLQESGSKHRARLKASTTSHWLHALLI